MRKRTWKRWPRFSSISESKEKKVSCWLPEPVSAASDCCWILHWAVACRRRRVGGSREALANQKRSWTDGLTSPDCIPLDEFNSGEVEYRFSGQSAHGLFVAFSIDGLAVSLQSAAQWNVTTLGLEKFWIDGEDLQTRIFLMSCMPPKSVTWKFTLESGCASGSRLLPL